MTASSDRLPSLDLLRGFAVMGIVLMNIIAFAMPTAAYFNPLAWGGTSFADLAAWFAAFVLVDGKMRGLFSLLYGASMLMLIDRAEMAGRDGVSEQVVRSAWLFGIGAAHFLLLWWGDILMSYAIIGCAALQFVHRESGSLIKFSFLSFLAHIVILLLWMAAIWLGAYHGNAEDAASTLAALGQPGTFEITAEVAIYRSGFGTILSHQMGSFLTHGLTLLVFAFDTLGFMLLGMAMLKGGFLTGRWNIDQYRRTARHCLLIGVPPMIALGIWAMASGFAPFTTFAIVFALSFPFRIPMTVAYAAIILMLLKRAPGNALIVRIAAAGRVALSNYLGTSLVLCAVFYGWGLGLFGHIDRAPVYLIALAVCALMLLWSKPWLDRFAYGPAEWLWRSAVRMKRQPFRRASI